MRAFAAFIALMAAAVVGGALLAYPVYALAHDFGADWPFHRVANRLAMLLLLIGLVWLLRRLGLANRRDLGYAPEPRRFVALALKALAVGVISMLPIIGLLLALGLRVPKEALGAGEAVQIALGGLVSAVLVALIEETFFRGAMHSAISRKNGRRENGRRENGARIAIVCTALVYASLHFLNRVRIPHEQVDWGSGFELMSRTFSAFAQPAAIADSFLALFAVGVLLGLARERFGHIAVCAGLHAGWVWVIAITRELTARDPQADWSFLVGAYDGVIGWLVLGWTLLLLLAFRLIERRLTRSAG